MDRSPASDTADDGNDQGVTGWRLATRIPAAALSIFEAAFARLGGALVTDAADRAGVVPVSVYLSRPPDRAGLLALLSAAAAAAGTPVPRVEFECLPSMDWVGESERALPPIRAGRFYVYGSHVREARPRHLIPIRIDASIAFGTGRHESTRGCLLALTALAKRKRLGRVLDMGCGSGILAIAAAKLGAGSVIAADCDPDAVAMTRTNARINRVAPMVRPRESDGYRDRTLGLSGPYDLVLANILAGPLCAMAADLRAALAPGGAAILSGLLRYQEPTVLARHRVAGLALARRVRLGEWSTLVLRG